MNYRTFKKRLAIYGADFTRWPEGEEEAARAFMGQSNKAQQSYAEALRLEETLNGFGAPFTGAALKDRVTAAAFRETQVSPKSQPRQRIAEKPRRDFFPWPMAPAGAAAVMAVALLFLSLSTRTVPVDAFLQEWGRMVTLAEQDLRQEDEMLDILVAVSSEAEVDRFLRELAAEEDGPWDYL